MSFQFTSRGSIRQDCFPGLPLEMVHTLGMAYYWVGFELLIHGGASLLAGPMLRSCVPSSENVGWTVSNGLLNDQRTLQTAWWNSHSG